MARPKKRLSSPQSQRADKYQLYLESVQAPDYEVAFFNRVFRNEYGRQPMLLREDFCGTAAVCCEWVKSHAKRRAIGIDLDPAPLVWGREHNLTPLKPDARARVMLTEGDVRDPDQTDADILAAQNFSYCCFKTRDELRSYFEIARGNLADEGVMILDVMGGSETQEDENEEITEHDGFDYVWELKSFDPVSYEVHYQIHFRFPDGSELTGFEYHWRHWTIPEMRELLADAGFTRTDVYWEATDQKTGDGNGVYVKRDRGDADPAWIAYIAAFK